MKKRNLDLDALTLTLSKVNQILRFGEQMPTYESSLRKAHYQYLSISV